MHLRLLSLLFAAVLSLGACSSTPDPSAGGSATSTTTSTTTSYASLQEQLRGEVGDRVFFEFDRYDLRPDAQATVQALAAWLNANPQVTITIEGHADERGTRDYNLALGERRANSVRQYLVSLGTNTNRLAVISYGEERPEALGSDEASWARNRRAVFVIN
ncbi:MAG TPA: peptidoglycan-associated lipoprotein Pal [Kiloniellales bacterium]|nr:peptidoglycan-associated lipoprotein Pal [Kiloniellales bacterium]